MSFSSPQYDQLLAALKECSLLEESMGLLNWDQETMMPKGASESRAEQKSVLAGVLHEKFTQPRLGDLAHQVAEQLRAHGKAEPTVESNLREFFWAYNRQTKIPKELVEKLEAAQTHAHEVWVKAREERRFAPFAPHLATLLELKKQEAAAIDSTRPAYDVRIDSFEFGLTAARIKVIFDELKIGLVPLLQRILESPRKPAEGVLHGFYPADKQKAFALNVVEAMGFDFSRGRLDTSVHPFCGGPGPTDVRITTRYDETNFCESFFAIVHETGHALYEQGLPAALRHQPVGSARSMGVHESQNLFWEKGIALSREFWEHYFPQAQKVFSPSLDKVSVEDFYRAIHVVKPSFIRVNADEVTYPLHIILRFELEHALFADQLKIADLPAAFRGKMKEYLGIDPPDDRMGVLQDVHWSLGAFGYFPSYNLGAIYASQLDRACMKALPDRAGEVRRGEFAALRGWLNREVHGRASLFDTAELIRQVTGEAISPRVHLERLEKVYGEVYGL